MNNEDSLSPYRGTTPSPLRSKAYARAESAQASAP